MPDGGSVPESVRTEEGPEECCQGPIELWGPMLFSEIETQGPDPNPGLLYPPILV